MTHPELPNRTRWAREGHCSSARRRALSRQRWLSRLPLPLGRACDEAAARLAWARGGSVGPGPGPRPHVSPGAQRRRWPQYEPLLHKPTWRIDRLSPALLPPAPLQ